MTGILRQMLTCHWSGRRIERHHDADPSAPLTPDEVARLEAHLATCERRAGLALHHRALALRHRALHRALSLWSGPAYVDPAAVNRVRIFLDELTEGPGRMTANDGHIGVRAASCLENLSRALHASLTSREARAGIVRAGIVGFLMYESVQSP